MQSKAETVDAYLAEQSAERRAALQRVRELIHATIPGVTEGMEYGMAVFYHGRSLCALASQKQYLALYVDPTVVAAHRAGLGKLDCGKSCIRFRKLADLPLDVVAKILLAADALGPAGPC